MSTIRLLLVMRTRGPSSCRSSPNCGASQLCSSFVAIAPDEHLFSLISVLGWIYPRLTNILWSCLEGSQLIFDHTCLAPQVTFPTFVLEPRSMLERITDFMSHPDLVFGYVPPLYSTLHPFLAYPIPLYESHLLPAPRTSRKPKYAFSKFSDTTCPGGITNHEASRNREPLYDCLLEHDRVLSCLANVGGRRYNPVLGEIFRCRFEYADGSSGFYVAEQGQSSYLDTFLTSSPDVNYFVSLPSPSNIRLLLCLPR